MLTTLPKLSRSLWGLLLLALFFLFPVPGLSKDWESPHALEEEEKAPVPLIPFPNQIKWENHNKGSLFLALKHPITIHADTATFDDSILPALKKALYGEILFSTAPLPKSSGVSISLDASRQDLGEEGYELNITDNSLKLVAAKNAGLFYGLQTLRQLQAPTKSPCFYRVHIKDVPAFPIRGFMHDTGRNFQTVDSLKKQLDEFARFKINIFHWHLTDNPAWRIESKKYPQLNKAENHKKGRDEGKFYTFDEIRDVIDYARKLHITIIPELDMPGHSAFFKPTFGFTMESQEGMKVLEELIDEFCHEIPKESCPILHIGTDEVHIKNPRDFVERMAKKVEANGRTVMQWKPGLQVVQGGISQLWSEGELVSRPTDKKAKFIDSSMGYLNVLDHPYLAIHRYFFRQLGGQEKGDDQAMGAILCLWPDARVEDKKNIARHNPQWPGLLTFAERIWKGAPTNGKQFGSQLPPADSHAGKAFSLFEKRLIALSRKISGPFPYWAHSQYQWKITPLIKTGSDQIDSLRKQLLSGKNPDDLKVINGASLMLRPRAKGEGVYPKAAPGNTVFAIFEIKAAKKGMYDFIVGFDSPARSSRKYSGIPQKGQWSVEGTKIYLNGKEIPGPAWKDAGKHFSKDDTWFSPLNEIPFTDEEIWWALPPVKFPLKKGINRFVVELPYAGAYQSWGVNLIPDPDSAAKLAPVK